MRIEIRGVRLAGHRAGLRRRAFVGGQMVMTTERKPLTELAVSLLEPLAGGAFIPRSVLVQAAGLYAGNVTDLFVHRMSHLRRALAPHGLVIDYYPGLGYRLRPATQPQPRAA